MITLKRLSVVMSVFTTGLVFAACASPTDTEIAEQPATDTTSSALIDEAEETAEEAGEDIREGAEDVGEGAEDVAEDVTGEERSVSEEQRYGDERGRGRAPRCNYRNVSHCTRGHRGWGWVDIGRGYGRGPRGSNYCCVRLQPRDHRDHRDHRDRGPYPGY